MSMLMLGWDDREWGVVQSWFSAQFPDWFPGDFVEMRRLWLHAHPGLTRPLVPPRYLLTMWRVDDTVQHKGVDQYEITTTGVAFTDPQTGGRYAYPIALFREVKAEVAA